MHRKLRAISRLPLQVVSFSELLEVRSIHTYSLASTRGMLGKRSLATKGFVKSLAIPAACFCEEASPDRNSLSNPTQAHNSL